VRFLSDEWLAALDAAAVAAGPGATPLDARLVVEQVVQGGRDPVRYHLVLDPSGGRVHRGPADRPDLVVTVDRVTAVALARGEENAQHALAAGRCKLRGRLDLLATHVEALQALDDVFAAVRAATDYDPADR